MAIIQRTIQETRELPYKQVGDALMIDDLNNIIYQLKKSRKVQLDYELDGLSMNGDLGNFIFTGDIEQVNNKYKTDGTFNIAGSGNIFRDATYTFVFTVIDENTSNTVQTRNVVYECDEEDGAIDLDVTNFGLAADEFIEPYVHVVVGFKPKMKPLNYDLIISVDKPIIQAGDDTAEPPVEAEVATLTFKLLHDGEGVVGATLNVECSSDSVDDFTVTTDSNGEATCTYTAEGIGGVVFTASYGILLQERYGLWDTLFHDEAIDGQKNNNWYISNTDNLTVSTDSNGTTLTSSGAVQYYSNSSSSINRYLTGKWSMEFDVVEYTGNINIRLNQLSSTYWDWQFSNKGITNGSHVKLTYNNDGTLTYQVDDNNPVTLNISVEFTGNLGLTFRFSGSGLSLKYKNFKVYSI